MVGETNIRFCDLVKSLRPLTGRGLTAGQQVAEVISMLTGVPDSRLGTDADPSHMASRETLRKMSSSDQSFTRKLANAIYECMDLDRFITRINEEDPLTKRQIADNLAEYGMNVDMDELGERCAEIAVTVISRKASMELNSESISARIARASGIARNKDALLMQCAGFCTECRRPLTSRKRGDDVSVYEILPIDADRSSYGFDDFVVMCPQCAARYRRHSGKNDIEHVWAKKRSLVKRQDFDGLLVPLNLEKELSQLLNDVKRLGMEATSHETGRMSNPVPIREKVPEDDELCREITDSVSLYYPFISSRMRMLEESQKLSFNGLLAQMHSQYLEYEGRGLEQSEVFDRLADWIAGRTSVRPRTASILVSYFVQICEVFRAPAQ